jgi:hypothetical protein
MPEPPEGRTTKDEAAPPTPFQAVMQVPQQMPLTRNEPSHNVEYLMVGIAVIIAVLFVLALALVWDFDCCGHESPPRSLGINMSASPDHTNWVLTLASVPTGIPVSSVKLTIFNASGVVIPPMNSVPFSSLTAENWHTYKARYDQGGAGNTMQVGDRILLNATSYPAGCKLQIFESRGILYVGILP